MTLGWKQQLKPGNTLRLLVQQATAALTAMDADRLEELALCCRDLNVEKASDSTGATDLHLSDRPKSLTVSDGSGNHRGEGGQMEVSARPEELATFVDGPAGWVPGPDTELELRILERVLFETRANLSVVAELYRMHLADLPSDFLRGPGQLLKNRCASMSIVRAPERTAVYGDD